MEQTLHAEAPVLLTSLSQSEYVSKSGVFWLLPSSAAPPPPVGAPLILLAARQSSVVSCDDHVHPPSPGLSPCPRHKRSRWQLVLYVTPSLPDYAQRSWRAALRPAGPAPPAPQYPASLAPTGSTSNVSKRTGRSARTHSHHATRSPRPTPAAPTSSPLIFPASPPSVRNRSPAALTPR